MLPSDTMQVTWLLNSTLMYLTFSNTVTEAKLLHTYSSPRKTYQSPNSLCKNQTCHVLCIRIINRSTLLWLKNRHPPPNHPWRIRTLPRWSNTSHHLKFHHPWPHPRHYGIQCVKYKWNAFLMLKCGGTQLLFSFLWEHGSTNRVS